MWGGAPAHNPYPGAAPVHNPYPGAHPAAPNPYPGTHSPVSNPYPGTQSPQSPEYSNPYPGATQPQPQPQQPAWQPPGQADPPLQEAAAAQSAVVVPEPAAEPPPPAYNQDEGGESDSPPDEKPVPAKKAEMIVNEHERIDMPIWSSVNKLKEKFGFEIWVYFDLSFYIIALTFVLSLMQLINFLVYTNSGADYNTIEGIRPGYYGLFIGSYPQSAKGAWYGTNVVSIIITLVFGPFYYRRVRNHIRKYALEELEDVREEEDNIIRYNKDGSLDLHTNYMTKKDFIIRFLLSWTFYLFLMTIQVLFSYFLTQAANARTGVVSILIAVMVAVLNLVCKKTASILTEFEKPLKWSVFRQRVILKLVIFKALNLLAVYAAKNYANKCPNDLIAEQFFWILVFDVAMNIVELVMPTIMNKIRRRIFSSSRMGDEALRAPFDTSEEYLQKYYALLVVCMSMVVFPLSAPFMCLVQILNLIVDRAKLLRICGQPKYSDASHKKQHFIFLTATAILGMVIPFSGSLWVLSTYTANGLGDTNCAFP